MYKSTILIVALSLCILLATRIQAQPKADSGVEKKAGTPTIDVTELKISDKTLKFCYEIKNDSEQDVWVCDNVHERYNFEVYLEEDGQTLMVRKRLDVPSSIDWFIQPFGKYMRLRPEEKRVESLLLTAPVNSVYVHKSKTSKQLHRVVNAKRLAVEIGYYVGDLPEMFFDMLKETEKTDLDKMILFNHWFGGVLGFNHRNEQLRQRDEEVIIPYTNQRFKSEQVLRTFIDNLNIPYKKTIERRPKYNPPDFTTCTRVEIEYEPSMLEYFYPYRSQQALLSREEMQYLRSETTIVLEDSERINDFANEIKQAEHGTGGIVSEKNKANVICYRDGRRVTSFIVYDNSSIETKQKQRIKYFNGFVNMRMLPPQIQPFELRMQCAANLKNLWYRLRFYDRAKKNRIYGHIKPEGPKIQPFELRMQWVTYPKNLWHPLLSYDSAEKSRLQSYSLIEFDDPDVSDMDQIEEELFREAQTFFEAEKRRLKYLYSIIELIYPEPTKWCETLEWYYAGGGIKSKWYESKMKSHVCPSVGEGRSTYAINSNCKHESPPDTVLLFETKAGWNQNGGSELFTFDNHDPHGGCVLLNDGTVKFIRTKEELQQLRWK